MKNVTLTETFRHGKKSWRLIGPDGLPIEAFDAFANSLLKKNSINTRTTYCRHLAEFFNYLYEAAIHYAHGEGLHAIDRETLTSIIENYDEYLVFGLDSGNDLIRRIASTLPSPRVSSASAVLKYAPIRKFIRMSERIRQQMQELKTAGLTSIPVDPLALFCGIGSNREITLSERQSMIGGSMIAGVLSGGPKLIEECIMPTSSPESTYDHERAFPFDKLPGLLIEFKTFRDKALYALCAASGCRISEALQILWEDIDTKAGTLKLVDYKKRPSHPSYLALSPEQRDRLVWKGRDTQETLLIEPFADMFFRNLEGYLREEYVAHGQHKFVFQYLVGIEKGLPYFLSAASSRNEVFHRARKMIGLNGPISSGPHSLRHMYGTYLVNYFPRSNGTFGLPIAQVQKLMGHKTMRATERYARHDHELRDIELRYAHAMIYQNGSPKTRNQLKRESLLLQLEHVEHEIEMEQKNLLKESS